MVFTNQQEALTIVGKLTWDLETAAEFSRRGRSSPFADTVCVGRSLLKTVIHMPKRKSSRSMKCMPHIRGASELTYS